MNGRWLIYEDNDRGKPREFGPKSKFYLVLSRFIEFYLVLSHVLSFYLVCFVLFSGLFLFVFALAFYFTGF